MIRGPGETPPKAATSPATQHRVTTRPAARGGLSGPQRRPAATGTDRNFHGNLEAALALAERLDLLQLLQRCIEQRLGVVELLLQLIGREAQVVARVAAARA